MCVRQNVHNCYSNIKNELCVGMRKPHWLEFELKLKRKRVNKSLVFSSEWQGGSVAYTPIYM